MRIGIYDPYLDDLGGGEKYMMTAAQCLSTKHDVTVFWDEKRDLVKLKNRFSLDLESISIEKNIFSNKVSFLERLSQSMRYDAIFFLSDGSIPFVLSKKLFLHLQQPLVNFNQRSLKGRVKALRVSGIFCNSQFTKSFNEKRFNIRTVVIYPPVNLLLKKVYKKNIILTVGRFRVANVKNEDYKKQRTMVNVFMNMVDKGLHEWKFVVATSVHDANDIKFKEMMEIAKGYPIEFLINKNNTQLWEMYNKAKIYWHASGFGEDLEKHPEYAEHFGISTVEAMGAGAVPVVINAGGQREIVTHGENGLLWNSLDELSDMTNELIIDANFWKKLSDSAKMRAKDFGTGKFCSAIEELLK